MITFFFPLTVLKNLEPRSSVLFYEICDIVELVYKIELMSSGKNESYRLANIKCHALVNDSGKIALLFIDIPAL